jgi:spermidine/putrescine-binding protein
MESAGELLDGMIKAKMLEKLEPARIPQWNSLPAYARDDHYVVNCVLQEGIVYNVKIFKEHGIEPPVHYSDLANEKLAGRVAFPDITHSVHLGAVCGLAYDAGGDETTLSKAVPLINKIRPSYFFSSSSELATKFGSGEIWAAPWHSGFAIRLQRAGLPVALAHPMVGKRVGSLWFNLYHVIADAPSREGAYDFLNAYLDPEVQYLVTKATGTIPVVPAARKRLQQEQGDNKTLILSDTEMDNMYHIDYRKIDMAKWQQTWSQDVHR